MTDSHPLPDTLTADSRPEPAASVPDEIAELNRRLRIATQQLEQSQKMAGIGELSSSMTHEFNNILTTIINYAKLGLRHRDAAQRDKAFDKILSAGQRAAKLTTGLLSYSRAGTQRRETHSLKRILNDVIVLVEKDLQVHRISLDLKTQGDPHAHVNANQIQQVLLNLIVNARQAMQPGGSLMVRIQERLDERQGEIVIADTGSGIPANQLAHIFDRFYTTKQADEAGQGGTGIGLALCREVMEAHGGRVRVESAVDHGTRFTLKFPLVEPKSILETCAAKSASDPEVAVASS